MEAITTDRAAGRRASAGVAAERALSFEREALPHLDSLYRFALSLARDPVYAEDLTQETLLRAYRSWHRYARGTNVRAWLFTILRNVVVSDYRRWSHRRRGVDLADLEGHAVLGGAQEVDPEGRILDSFVASEVVRAIRMLPPDYREVVMLRDVEGLSYGEIAVIVGVPVGTVKSRLFRARQLLQRRLRDYAVAAGYIRPSAIAVEG